VKGGVGYFLPDTVERPRVSPRDQQAVTRRDDAFGDRRNLFRSLAGTEDYLRKSLPECAMVVDSREADVFKWRLAQKLKKPTVGLLRCQALCLDILQEGAEVLAVHRPEAPPLFDGNSSRTVKSAFMLSLGFILL
jgi:hypothetical protein